MLGRRTAILGVMSGASASSGIGEGKKKRKMKKAIANKAKGTQSYEYSPVKKAAKTVKRGLSNMGDRLASGLEAGKQRRQMKRNMREGGQGEMKEVKCRGGKCTVKRPPGV